MWILSSCDGTVILLEHVSDNVPTLCCNASSHSERDASYSFLKAIQIRKTLQRNVRWEIWDCHDSGCEDLRVPVWACLKYVTDPVGKLRDVDGGRAGKPSAETTWLYTAVWSINSMLQSCVWKTSVRRASQEIYRLQLQVVSVKTKLYYLKNQLFFRLLLVAIIRPMPRI